MPDTKLTITFPTQAVVYLIILVTIFLAGLLGLVWLECYPDLQWTNEDGFRFHCEERTAQTSRQGIASSQNPRGPPRHP